MGVERITLQDIISGIPSLLNILVKGYDVVRGESAAQINAQYCTLLPITYGGTPPSAGFIKGYNDEALKLGIPLWGQPQQPQQES